MHLDPARELRRSDTTREQVVPLRRIEAAWPWFQGFYGLMMLLFYREILRLMFWARAMNW